MWNETSNCPSALKGLKFATTGGHSLGSTAVFFGDTASRARPNSISWPVTSFLTDERSLGDRRELIAEFFGLSRQILDTTGLVSPFVCLRTLIQVRLPHRSK